MVRKKKSSIDNPQSPIEPAGLVIPEEICAPPTTAHQAADTSYLILHPFPTCPDCACTHCPIVDRRSLSRGRVRVEHCCRHCGRTFHRLAPTL
jgi:hypothetical protein